MTVPVKVGPSPVGGGPVPSPRPLLTTNELLVLQRASEGFTYAAIAADLVMAEKSISKIALRLARKLGARNITHSVFLACQAGILDGSRRRHGDHAGFAAHVYRGETPCDWCKDGERAYRRARDARKSDAS